MHPDVFRLTVSHIKRGKVDICMFERSLKEQYEAQVFGNGYSLQDFLHASADCTLEDKIAAYLDYASSSGKPFPIFAAEVARALKEKPDLGREAGRLLSEGTFQVTPGSTFAFLPGIPGKAGSSYSQDGVLRLHTTEVGVEDGPLPGEIEIHPQEGFLTYSMDGIDEGEKYSWHEKASIGEDGSISRIDKCITLDPGSPLKADNQMKSVVIYPKDGREIHIDQPGKPVRPGDAATARVYGADGIQTSFEKVPLEGKDLDELETDEIMQAIDPIEDASAMDIGSELSEETARDLIEEALWQNDEADMHWGDFFEIS